MNAAPVFLWRSVGLPSKFRGFELPDISFRFLSFFSAIPDRKKRKDRGSHDTLAHEKNPG
jgi:hypothetical protein